MKPFHSPEKLVAKVALAPSIRASADKTRCGHITKQGYAAKYALKSEFDEIVQDQVERLAAEIRRPLELKEGVSYDECNEKLAQVYLELGSILSMSKLQKAIEAVTRFIQHELPRILAHDPHYLVKVLSLKNAAQVATVILKQMLHRKESRGSLINEDFQETDNDDWLTWTRARLREDGEVEVWDVPIPEEVYIYRKPSRGRKLHPIFEALKTHGAAN